MVRPLQVMALLAYLMENKNVFGPHLIIVPNAVIVNWKAELTQWLPNVRCVYYVGTKDERSRKYAAEVQSLQFNVLVTTYEFIMRDRAKLSKVGASPLLGCLKASSRSLRRLWLAAAGARLSVAGCGMPGNPRNRNGERPAVSTTLL